MSNMIKRAFVQVEGTEKLMIDSNSQLIKKMDEIINTAPEAAFPGMGEEGGSEEFMEGIVADRVGMLLGEGGEGEEAEADAPSNVIKGGGNEEPDYSEAAQAVLAEAEEQARLIVQEAEQNAAATLENARNEGFNAGHDEGYQAGYQEAEALKSQYEEMMNSLEEEYQRRLEQLEPALVDTLSDIYSHIFHVDLAEKKDIILYLLQSALFTTDGSSGLIIHVSKDDHSLITERRDELLEGYSGADNVEIVEDITLKSGECFIDTGSGIFDCSLGTELSGLRKELKLLSYEKQEEVPGDG